MTGTPYRHDKIRLSMAYANHKEVIPQSVNHALNILTHTKYWTLRALTTSSRTGQVIILEGFTQLDLLVHVGAKFVHRLTTCDTNLATWYIAFVLPKLVMYNTGRVKSSSLHWFENNTR